MDDRPSIPFHDNEIAFEVCKRTLYVCYEVGAEAKAKRELYDMLLIANGRTPERKWGGAEIEIDDEGTVSLSKNISKCVEAVDAEIIVGGTNE